MIRVLLIIVALAVAIPMATSSPSAYGLSAEYLLFFLRILSRMGDLIQVVSKCPTFLLPLNHHSCACPGFLNTAFSCTSDNQNVLCSGTAVDNYFDVPPLQFIYLLLIVGKNHCLLE